ncbi:MAG: lytic murein transglycosylase [Acidimicrobiales bacterium]
MIGLLAGLLVTANPVALPGPGDARHQGLAGTAGAASTIAEPPSRAEALLGVGDPSSTVLPELNVLPLGEGHTARAEQDVRLVLQAITAARADAERAMEAERQTLAAGSALQAEAERLGAGHASAVAARQRALQDAEAAQRRAVLHEGRAASAKAALETVAVQAYMSGIATSRGEVTVNSDNPGPGEVLAARDPTVTQDEHGPAAGQELSPTLRRAGYLDGVAAHQQLTRRAEEAARGVAQADERAARRRAADHDAERVAIEHTQAANVAARTANEDALQAARAALIRAEAGAERLVADLVAAKANLADVRRTATVEGTDLPLVVLDALVRAARQQAVDHPACHLSWSLLAGVSRVESGHGDVGGGVDALGGTRNILGPRLAPETGEDVAVVPDSDGGALDGDPLYDRAVGPMQFIPSSWQLYGRDGNGDGVADPHNYYDAALAAGEHLCRAGQDTATAEGRRAALLGYNQSEAYQLMVSELAERYAKLKW